MTTTDGRSRSREGYAVLKPGYTNREGQRRKQRRWHARFRDHRGIWRRLPAFTDKAGSVTFARRLLALAEVRAVGERPAGELAHWLNDQPEAVVSKLAEWDVIDRGAVTALHGLEVHLEAWRDSIIDAGRTTNHADLLHARALAIVRGCDFSRYADIDTAKVEQLVARLRRGGKSTRTANFYLKATQQFCRWMVRNGRAHGLPLDNTTAATVTDEKQRRALADQELVKLMQHTAEHGKLRGRSTGPERALIYGVAAATGLRANEIRTLTAGAFDLRPDKDPTVTVHAKYAKNRRKVTLPLRADLAALLRSHFAGKHPSASAFYLPRTTADLIRQDATAAGIPIETAEGALDFHSLRVTFITSLARSGVHPKVAQQLARHSTIHLTMDVYTKFGADDQRAGVEAMPALPVLPAAAPSAS